MVVDDSGSWNPNPGPSHHFPFFQTADRSRTRHHILGLVQPRTLHKVIHFTPVWGQTKKRIIRFHVD